jgi:hypothetical protein
MMEMQRLVQNVSDWHLMDGETPAIKKLNSLLTGQLVDPREIPADECVEEARHLAILWDKGRGWERRAERYLVGQFVAIPTDEIPLVALDIPLVVQQAGRILSGKVKN